MTAPQRFGRLFYSITLLGDDGGYCAEISDANRKTLHLTEMTSTALFAAIAAQRWIIDNTIKIVKPKREDAR